MIRSLAILAVSLWACTGGQSQSTDDEIRLRATVRAVVPLTSFSGAITPVDIDPRFALTVQIESAVPAVTDFNAGAVVTLAIHSPSLFFGGEATNGKTYEFLLHRKIKDGKVRFFGLEARKLSTPEKQHLLDGRFALVASTAAVPQSLKDAFAAITGEQHFELADSGKEYQATDFIVKPGLPSRRMILAGANGEKWFIHYEHGGRGHNYAVVVFRKEPQGGVEFLWGGVGIEPAKDLDDLGKKSLTVSSATTVPTIGDKSQFHQRPRRTADAWWLHCCKPRAKSSSSRNY